VDALVTGGGLISERWKEGVLPKILNDSRYDVIVLQEQGGLLACMSLQTRSDACQDSVVAHEAIANLAATRGTKVVLFGTWPRNIEQQPALSLGEFRLSEILHATVADIGTVFARSKSLFPRQALLSDDSGHPTLYGSVLAAIVLHKAILGTYPVARDLSAPIDLYPPEYYFSAQKLVSEQTFHQPAPLVRIGAKQISRGVFAAKSSRDRR
jgi:hypothetical protein